MRFSTFYARTNKSAARKDSINAYLLTKAGYVHQVAAGAFDLLPLGLRSIKKIEQIVREEMNAIGASELALTSLQPKQVWQQSKRWDDPNFKGIFYYDQDTEMTFAPTHEEPLTQLLKESIQSYRDLPVLLYQFQTKFRKELRAKSGLLRGREFRMKDLYSFHLDEKSHNQFYEQTAKAYQKVFDRLGLEAYRVKASGGAFSNEFSDEFQIICQTGEDEILINTKDKTGYNQEVEGKVAEKEKKSLERVHSIEVGNIFHLGTKYADAFGMTYLDTAGKRHPIVMGSYGIGISRLLGTLAEIHNDEHGLQLPWQVAPFQIYLIDLTTTKQGEKLEKELEAVGFEVFYDDREETAGVKMVDADLIGLPIRLVYSAKTAQDGKIELKHRASGKVQLLNLDELVKCLKQFFS